MDKPKAVEEARDKAATVEQMNIATKNLLLLNKAEGAPDGSHMTPQEAFENSMTAAGIKTVTKKETGFKVDSETLKVFGEVAAGIIQAIKTK